MNAAERDHPPSTARAAERAFAVRAADGALAPTSSRENRRSTCSVGEPQHPIPPFVGPVLAAHLNDFGRYPANKGTERFRRAAADWLGRRYRLPRPLDPESEVLVLNGTREGLFLARHRRQALCAAARRNAGDPDPQSVLCAPMRPAPPPPIASRSICRRPRRPAFSPISMRSTRRCSRAPSPSTSPRRRTRRARSPISHYLARLVALARRFGFLVFADECYSEIYFGEQPPPACWRPPAPDFANVVVFHSLSKRSNLPGLRVGFAAGDRRFLARFSSCATSRRRRCRCRRRRSRSPPMATKRMWTENRELYVAEIRSRRPDHRRSLRLSSGRPAASSSGST